MSNSKALTEKWSPVLGHEGSVAIKDNYRKAVTAVLLENTESQLREERGMINEASNTVGAIGTNALSGSGLGTQTGGLAGFDPVMISLIRRAMPNLVAYDICGVQPMSGPTGLIFAMKSHYQENGAALRAGSEALYNEPDTNFSGNSQGPAAYNDPVSPLGDGGTTDANPGLLNDASGGGTTAGNYERQAGNIAREDAETLGSGSTLFNEMSFSIEKTSVTAKTRALKAEYTLELAQDLKAIHGLDAETELANILSTEILAEINREVIRTINSQAKTGALQASTAINGVFNMSSDADGRWSVEKFKGLIVQIEREANVIAKETRRGKGNFIICSSDVASALTASGMLDYSPALSTNLSVDDTGNTFAGVLNGRTRVYIDPYATVDYVTVGYKGTNPYDAGIFYCPYVPLTMVRAVGEENFQPKIGFKTRYGMASNPFVGATPANGLAAAKSNQYYRIFRVDNIMA